jgi:NAD(P)-dependent dehydrogenase (short-subunit alcohol dehydrogenase family)
MANWENRVWLITGTSSGFGREIARAVVAAGGRVVATARRPQQLEPLVASAPERVLALELDVERPQTIAVAVQAAEQRFGSIDVLINNAGYGLIGTIEQVPDEEIRRLFEVNVFGLIATTRAVLPGMRRRRRGFIVNISSGAGLGGHAGSAYYCSSKFAVEGFTESLRGEVAPVGIQAMAVEPGFFKTEFGYNVKAVPDVLPDYEASAGVTLKRMAMMKGREPGDPARAAQAIIAAMNAPKPPGQLVLGAVAFDGITARMTERLASIEAWRELARGADFPAS